jgi:hypothetical protein
MSRRVGTGPAPSISSRVFYSNYLEDEGRIAIANEISLATMDKFRDDYLSYLIFSSYGCL